MNDSVFSAPFTVEIPPLTIAKARVISTNPEQEVIARLQDWAKKQGIDTSKSRAFGFDAPVSREQKSQGIRGYEYWLQVPDSVVPAQAGTHAVFEKDSVIPAQAGIQPPHVVPANAGTSGPPSSEGRQVEPFPGGTYIALRITDPFADPFDRIPQGWQTLVTYIKENNLKADWCTPSFCLESYNHRQCLLYGCDNVIQ